MRQNTFLEEGFTGGVGVAAGGNEGAVREGWWCSHSNSHTESLPLFLVAALKVSVTVKVCFLIKRANLLKPVEGFAVTSEF